MGDGNSSESGSPRAGPRRLTISTDTPPGDGCSARRSTAGDGCCAAASGLNITNSVSPARHEQLDEPADRPAAPRQLDRQRRIAGIDRARAAARELRASPERRVQRLEGKRGSGHRIADNCTFIQYMATRPPRTAADVKPAFRQRIGRKRIGTRDGSAAMRSRPHRFLGHRRASPGGHRKPPMPAGRGGRSCAAAAGIARQPSSSASSSSFSCRVFSNSCSRSGTSSPRRSSPDTSSTTCP